MRAIRKFRSENKNIVYLDETWIDNDMTFKKCWQDNEVFGVTGSIRNTCLCLIVVPAANEKGCVPNALLIFRSGLTTGDCHAQMNRANFQKWLEERLLPNIPSGTVIVLDNASYHSERIIKIPTKYSCKSDMSAWLVKMKIEEV